MAGLAIGLIIIFLLDLFDRRLKTEEAIEAPLRPGRADRGAEPRRRARPGSRSSQAELEPFRILRDGLAHVSLRQDMRVVLVTSAISGEGKTRVASGLARAIAAAGKRVALVEGDVHRPAVRKEFGLASPGSGPDERARGRWRYELADPARRATSRISAILPSGPFTPNSAELLRLPAMVEVLSGLAAAHDFVIIDGAPLLPVADSQVLLDNPMIDVVLLVARPYLTTREHIRLTMSVIARHPDKGVGLAINGVREKAHGYYGYAGEYQDENAMLPEAAARRDAERTLPAPARRIRRADGARAGTGPQRSASPMTGSRPRAESRGPAPPAVIAGPEPADPLTRP